MLLVFVFSSVLPRLVNWLVLPIEFVHISKLCCWWL